MDLHHLRHFVAVAEDLHFGRAALRLGIAQPALSQSLKRLEESVGVKLLERNRRSVALTDAGKVMLEQGRLILEQSETAVRLSQRAAFKQIDQLSVGFAPWALSRALPQAVRQFQGKWPGVMVQLDERTSKHQVAALHAGTMDLGVINLHSVEMQGLETRTVETSQIVAAVPSTWEIARRERISMADLAKLPFILFPLSWSPGFYAAVMRSCQAAGFEPHVTQKVRQMQVAFNLIANELGVTLVNDTATHVGAAGVTFVPITDFAPDYRVETALAWLPRAINPVLRDFIDTVERLAKAAQA